MVLVTVLEVRGARVVGVDGAVVGVDGAVVGGGGGGDVVGCGGGGVGFGDGDGGFAIVVVAMGATRRCYCGPTIVSVISLYRILALSVRSCLHLHYASADS